MGTNGQTPGCAILCCARGTAKTFLCFSLHRSTRAQKATRRFVLSILVLLSSMRGKKQPFTDEQTDPDEGSKCRIARLRGLSSTAGAVTSDTSLGDRRAGELLGLGPSPRPPQSLLWSLSCSRGRSPLRSLCSPQDEVLELLWSQNDRLQRLPGADGLQQREALLGREEGKGARGEGNSCVSKVLLLAPNECYFKGRTHTLCIHMDFCI